eukprot:20442-Amphidinium_carterae.1
MVLYMSRFRRLIECLLLLTLSYGGDHDQEGCAPAKLSASEAVDCMRFTAFTALLITTTRSFLFFGAYCAFARQALSKVLQKVKPEWSEKERNAVVAKLGTIGVTNPQVRCPLGHWGFVRDW